MNGPVLIRHEDLRAPLPTHCWRCQAAIYRVGVVVVRQGDGLPRPHGGLNQQITWYPEHVPRTASSASGCRSARDWSIPESLLGYPDSGMEESTTQPTPRIDVYGSLDELVRLRPICRPYIDELTVPTQTIRLAMARCDAFPMCSACGSTRDPCRSARVHYPFENLDWFQGHYPGDFIVEYIRQTRGWFYTLHVLATAL